MSELVSYELQDGVATVQMDDGKANVLSLEMIEAMNAALDRAESEAKVLVIRGRPGLTCAGFDLRVIKTDPDATVAMANAGGELLLRIYLFPLPVVIASTGHAVGAGALLLLAGDYRVAGDADCVIVLNEVAQGMSLPGFAIELARDRLVNTALTQAALFSRPHDPALAREAGYVDEVVSMDELFAAADEKAQDLAALDGPAFAASKLSFRADIVERVASHPPLTAEDQS